MHDIASYTISNELEGESIIECLALCRALLVHKEAAEAEWMQPCGVKGSTQIEKIDSHPTKMGNLGLFSSQSPLPRVPQIQSHRALRGFQNRF